LDDYVGEDSVTSVIDIFLFIPVVASKNEKPA
jgi:hypothetical protein